MSTKNFSEKKRRHHWSSQAIFGVFIIIVVTDAIQSRQLLVLMTGMTQTFTNGLMKLWKERFQEKNIYIIVPVVAYSGKFCAVHGRKITEAVRLHDKINNLDKMSYFIHDIHFPTRNLTTFDVTTVHFHHTLHSLYSIFEGWA